MSGRVTFAAMMVWAALSAGAAAAGEVELLANSSKVFVDVPFTVAVEVTSSDEHTQPQFPELDGAVVSSAGQASSTSSSIQITLNGRNMVRTQTMRYFYKITPKKEGRLVVPPIEVRVDGQTLRTSARQFEVAKAETGDLLFVELLATQEEVYIGEGVDMTLEVWLQPYADRNISLNEQQMWQMIDLDLSEWGPFADMLKRPEVTVRAARRQDAEGVTRSYFVYTLNKRVWPDRAGPLAAHEIRVVVNYPLGVARDRFSFFNNLKVTSRKTLVGAVDKSPVMVKSIPDEDRPVYFTGAVGPHRLRITATPRKLRVGDPITLNMIVTGQGRLDLLQAPPLARMSELAGKFQVSDEQLAGVVEGTHKRFTHSIRPLTDEVTEIPAIPFAYFDPDQGAFVTVYSQPIPIEVEAAERMSAAQIVEAAGDPAGAIRSLTQLQTGIEGNYVDPALVLSQQGFRVGPGTAVLAVAPPVVYALCMLLVQTRRRRASDVAGSRRRRARRNAEQAIQASRSIADPAESAAALENALLHYVADRLNLPAGGLTAADAVQALGSAGADEVVVRQTHEVLDECDAWRFGGAAAASTEGLRVRVERCIASLEQWKK